MKRISYALAVLIVAISCSMHAQDAATEERLNKLSGQIEDLIAAQRAQQKQMEALVREMDSVREQASKPAGNYATPEDVKRVAEAVKEVDRKRIEDADKVAAQLQKLGKTLAATPPPPKKTSTTKSAESDTASERPAKDEKGYPYTIQSGDTLSLIVQAYREKNIKVTTDQILKANPGLKAEKLRAGQKIWIPAPQT